MIIRLLNQEEWESWKNLRLEALYNEPEAFCTSFEQESNRSDEEFKAILSHNAIFGAFEDDELIGASGFVSLSSLKTQHRGTLWGMYVKVNHRRKGIADSLINTIIAHAKSHVIQLHLTVMESNFGAMRLYHKHGFTVYATEPRSLKIGDRFVDEHLMILRFE